MSATAERLFEDSIWTVDEYCNKVTKRKSSAANAKEYLRPSQPLYKHIFSTEAEAVDFMIDRAKKKVGQKWLDLQTAEAALKRLCKKYNREASR